MDAGGYKTEAWWVRGGWFGVKYEGWKEPLHWWEKHWNQTNYPVVGVSWHEAQAFCTWLSHTTQEKIVLPTEQMWQHAAQGDEKYVFPWGNQWDENRCNNNISRKNLGTTPVDAYEGKGDSPFGVVDMVGNMWEWCDLDTASEPLSNLSPHRLPSRGSPPKRGGSWERRNIQEFACSARDPFRFLSWGESFSRNNTIGFRIAHIS